MTERCSLRRGVLAAVLLLALLALLALPAIREAYAKSAGQVVGNTPAEFGAFIRAEQTKWAAIVKSTGIKAE